MVESELTKKAHKLKDIFLKQSPNMDYAFTIAYDFLRLEFWEDMAKICGGNPKVNFDYYNKIVKDD